MTKLVEAIAEAVSAAIDSFTEGLLEYADLHRKDVQSRYWRGYDDAIHDMEER